MINYAFVGDPSLSATTRSCALNVRDPNFKVFVKYQDPQIKK